MILGGTGGITLSGLFHILHEISGVCSDLAGIGGFILVAVGLIKWARSGKDK